MTLPSIYILKNRHQYIALNHHIKASSGWRSSIEDALEHLPTKPDAQGTSYYSWRAFQDKKHITPEDVPKQYILVEIMDSNTHPEYFI